MRCPKCGGKLKVIDRAFNTEDNEVYKELVCCSCEHVIYTVEYEVVVNRKFMDMYRKFSKKFCRRKERYYEEND